MPFIPAVEGNSPLLELKVGGIDELRALQVDPGAPVGVYVCGITPYDATHIGHAATYVTFDLAIRSLIDHGLDVHYVQNITDIDDPLLERAARDGIRWQDLAAAEIDLFRSDMTALQVIPPQDYLGVVESMDLIVSAIEGLVTSGAVYAVPAPDASVAGAADYYFDNSSVDSFGQVSRLDGDEMLELFRERGGDPDRAGKRDALDALVWRAARDGEPSWEGGSLGAGRPGWHIECSALAVQNLGMGFGLQGGGTDLIFPHHEMSAAHAVAMTGAPEFAQSYAHQAMVGFDGEKMSKSKGNLVRVSDLLADGVDPVAIRLALLAHHYAGEWEWTPETLTAANERANLWRAALSGNSAPDATATIDQVRLAIATDLDAPAALAAVDAWAAEALESEGSHPTAAGELSRALDAVLGIRF